MENEKTSYEYTKEDIQVTPDLIDAVVINMETKSAKEIFGDKADKPDNTMLVIHCENESLGVRIKEHCTFFERGSVPDNSNLAKIIDFYKELKVGMKVQLLKNPKGFYDIRK